LPFRGPAAPLLTRDELENMVEIHHDYHCETFDLTDPEQKARYVHVMTRVVNGWYIVHKSTEPTPTTRILEWSQRYGELSPSAKAAIGGRSYDVPR
jgi:hypothetical protein